MATGSSLAHRNVRDPGTLPYISNQGPTVTEACYIKGSTDILTNINAYAQRRPGFADSVETTPTVFINLQRLFTWDRFDGTFYVMFCDVQASGICKVYKYQVGTDTSAVLIYTEPSATGTPYDFVVSNNTVYFSNGFYVRKWDPINGLSNWGIAPYSASGSASGYGGTGANVTYTGVAWSNPTNAQGAPDGSYASIGPLTSLGFTDNLQLTNYGFSIPAGNTITGMSISVTGHTTQNTPPNDIHYIASIVQNGTIGGPFGYFTLTSSDTTVTIGGPSNLPYPLSPNVVNNSGFGIAVLGYPNNSNSVTGFIDAIQITIYSSGAPSVTLTGTGLTASTGYQYVICWGNSNTGHISSPCPPSNLVKPTNQSISIPVVASTDPQVNQIRIFRTTDSATGLGGQSYFEIPNSPVANSSTSITDSATDLQLNIYSLAPTPTYNDPPPPMRGMQYFAGRIHGFTANKVWFSGLEEIPSGVPEECFPSGVAGNFWSFDQPVQGEGVAGTGSSQILGILCGGRLFAISGNTLDTFTKNLVSSRRGCRNLVCVDTIGGMVAWLDSANQIWASNGSSLQELSIPIRPDLVGIDQTKCCLTFHTSGNYHWLVFSTGTKLFLYDIDQEIWMPPWTFACKYIHSGETSPGNYVLMASTGTKAVQLSTSAFNDNGTTYQPIIKTNLFSVIPDFGRRFNYVAGGVYDEPTKTGIPYFVGIDNNGKSLSDVLYITDEDPTQGSFTSIASTLVDTGVAYNRTNGTYLKQNIYTLNQPACRWIGLQIKLANADQTDILYGWYVAYETRNARG